MPNANRSVPHPNNDLDRLMRELNEESSTIEHLGDVSGASALPVQQFQQPVQQPIAQPVQPPMVQQTVAQPVQQPAHCPIIQQPTQNPVAGYQGQGMPMYPQQNVGYQMNNPAYNQTVRQNRFNNRTTNGYAFSFGDEAQPAVPVQNATAAEAVLPKKAALSKAKLIRDSIMLVGMILVFTLSSMVMLSSGIKKPATNSEQKSFFEDLHSEFLSFKSDAVSAIFEIPKVYILPWGEQPVPKPNPEGFSSYVNDDGTEVLTYDDATISVKYWVERQYKSNVHFAEIKVAHPTQLRTAYAGGEFGSSVKYMPQEIAQHVNAVIAINADYCGYRTGGIIVRQNTLYRDTPRGWDILLIDSEGNFHIMADSEVYPSGVMEQYEIVNTLEFGPSLVVDGEIKIIDENSGCGYTWNEVNPSPRTGIGQLGELHYLFCVVEGRSDNSRGVLTSQLAEIMHSKGCTQAYNLDGGQSTTIILNGEAMNEPLWGAQRVVTDIIYCATAIPNGEGAAANE